MNILDFTQKFQFRASFRRNVTLSAAAALAAEVSPKDVTITRDFDTIEIKWTDDEVKNKYNSNIENVLHAYYKTLCEALSDEKIEPVYTDEDNAYFRDKANQLHNEVRHRTMTKREANEIYYRDRDIYVLEQNKSGRCLFRCDSISRLFTEIGFDGVNNKYFNPIPATPEEPAVINNDDSKKQPAEKAGKESRSIISLGRKKIDLSGYKAFYSGLQGNVKRIAELHYEYGCKNVDIANIIPCSAAYVTKVLKKHTTALDDRLKNIEKELI